MGIVDAIEKLDPPGRFLMEDPNSANAGWTGVSILDKVWIRVESNETVVEKVMHRLREKQGTSTVLGYDTTRRAAAPHQQQQHSAHSSLPETPMGVPSTGGVAAAGMGVPITSHLNALQQQNQQLISSEGFAPFLPQSVDNNFLSMLAGLSQAGGQQSYASSQPKDQLVGSNDGKGKDGYTPEIAQQRAVGRHLAGAEGITADNASDIISVQNSLQDWIKSGCELPSNTPYNTKGMHRMRDDKEEATVDGDTTIMAAAPLQQQQHPGIMEGITADNAPGNASVPISIQDWMESACDQPSKSPYLESAVNLAWALTNHIGEKMVADPKVKLEDHVTTENVVIFVSHWPPSSLLGIYCAPVVTDVELSSELWGSASSAKESSTPSSSSSNPRAVCVALGKTLLEIFSGGRSGSLELSSSTATLTVDTASTQHNSTTASDVMPSAGKRKALTVPTNGGSVSKMANNLLLHLGMPLSICRLVGDLLDAGNEQCPSTALTSVEEALWDLTCMKNNPQSFLFDRTCPQKALDDSHLFGSTDYQRDENDLFGRELEIDKLMQAKKKVSDHVHHNTNHSASTTSQGNNFLIETAFLSGYAGSGKSSLLRSLVHSCNEEKWFVLRCKFDKHAAPYMVLSKAFDDFFGKWGQVNNDDTLPSDLDPSMTVLFYKVWRNIFSAIDNDGFDQLCDLVPNFSRIFPLMSSRTKTQDPEGISSMEKVGSATKRLMNLFHVLVESLCSTGCPVLFALDDLQWAGSFIMEGMTDFIGNYMHEKSSMGGQTSQGGLFLVGAYRSNEVKESDVLIRRINFIKQSGKADVTLLSIGELAKADITKLLSTKLCLPWRYTLELAGLVHSKTRGNPFFVIQFLRTIVQNKMLEFSIRSRRWIWDYDVVDLQMISKGVAELLSTTFNHLPSELTKTLKIASCLGCRVEKSTVDALDSRNEVLPFSMLNQLELAIKEGILERAGPLYQFTHDIIQQTVYELIPAGSRILLHKTVGENLLKYATNNCSLHLLAVDQINIYCKDSNPSPEERSRFANSNSVAAKFAISASSFEQARSYIDSGIKLLDTQHWETQYSLSLGLFEMSASVSCMHGDIPAMSTCVNEILSHSKTFDDGLKAYSLLVKLLASSSKFEEARSTCLMILSNLKEEFPSEVSLPLVLSQISDIQTAVKNITVDQIKLLPPMTDRNKLHSMMFLNMLCVCSKLSKPMLVPFLSSRMVKLMMTHGFCADGIVGLATAAHSVFLFTEEIQLAFDIGKVCEILVEESPKKHILRSRLCDELFFTLKVAKEPCQSVTALLPGLTTSSLMAGDVENAVYSRCTYCITLFYTGMIDLVSVSKYSVLCIKEAEKYQQNAMGGYIVMALLNTCIHLSGIGNNEVEVKSLDELNDIGERTNNVYLIWHVFMCRMSNHFWMREYTLLAELSEKFSDIHPSSRNEKRILRVMRTLYEGVAYLSLARDTQQSKWRVLGEKASAEMSKFELTMCKWNFENKAKLLQAELHYLNGDIESAEVAYKASVKSAREHKFVHEEALAYELYGLFCVKNEMVDKGFEQLHVALNRYKEWGAMKKVEELQLFIGTVDPG